MRRNLRLSRMLGASPVAPFNPKARAAALEQARVEWGAVCEAVKRGEWPDIPMIRGGFNGVYGYPDDGTEMSSGVIF